VPTFRKTRAKEKLIDRLELKKNAWVLETGLATAGTCRLFADCVGKDGHLDGLDISSECLKVAYRKMKAKGVQVTVIQGNALYLPFKAATFDAVLHGGALNVFEDKKQAIEEVWRVAKPGAKIVICDEGLAPGREKTLLGKCILQCAPVLFAHKPRLSLVPKGIQDLKLYWVWQKTLGHRV
jgi:ubiquinone/menaquinone biosynthesis C-methylase UbiE